MEPRTFTKERIKSRILKKAADLWGYQEAEIDAFDPLVNLLVEATSVEFEKVYQEINATQNRLVDRLANLMIPDILDTTKPAYSILKVRSVEPEGTVPIDAQFVFRKPAANRNTTENSEFFFSPLRACKIWDGSVKMLATYNAIYQIEQGNQKIPFITTENATANDARSLWIGLELNTKIETLQNISFFFDWQNEPSRDYFYQNLPFCRWFLGNQELNLSNGIAKQETAKGNVLEEEFNIAQQIENQIDAIFDKCFITVQTTKKWSEMGGVLQKYPPEFEQLFSWNELKGMKNDLLWLRVEFPHFLPLEVLHNIFCGINCLPVINRRLYKLTYRLQQHTNIIPLESNESFLVVKDVRNTNNAIFRPIPFGNFQDLAIETYTLRQQGVGRFDSRNAKELLYYVLEVLRDESASFSALGEDFLTSIIRELNQNIARLEQKVNQDQVSKSPSPYMIVKPKNAGENIYIEFWATNGEAANKIPSGSKLAAYSGSYLDKNDIFLITSTTGGKEKLSASEKVYTYKKTILSRSRIVTLEDIKTFCQAELGKRVKKVEIQKGFKTAGNTQSGFTRCIQIGLTPTDARSQSNEEWRNICERLQAQLTIQSANNLPYLVRVM